MSTVTIPDGLTKITKIQAKEQQLYWDRFFTSEEYRNSLKDRMLNGKAGHMEVLLHHVVYGKPRETLELSGGGDGTFILIIGDREIKKQLTNGGEIIDAPALVEHSDEPAHATGG